MENKSKERLIKEIIIESNKLLELVQWIDQKEDIQKMRIIPNNVKTKCDNLEKELG